MTHLKKGGSSVYSRSQAAMNASLSCLAVVLMLDKGYSNELKLSSRVVYVS